MGRAPAGHLTIAETAARLDIDTWDVLQLINQGHLDTLTYVNAASLKTYQEAS